MDKRELLKMLAELDKGLSAPCEVVVVGGAAMILHFGASRATRDVDILPLRGDMAELRQAVARVADLHNLPEDWMNDAAKGFGDILPRDFYLRLVPLDLPLEHLRLYTLGTPEQVAMKIVALREQDLELLLPGLSEKDKQTLISIMHQVASFRPDWAQKIRYFLLQQGWAVE